MRTFSINSLCNEENMLTYMYNGKRIKYIAKIDDRIKYIKYPSKRKDGTFNSIDTACEVIAGRVGKILGINVLEHEPIVVNDELMGTDVVAALSNDYSWGSFERITLNTYFVCNRTSENENILEFAKRIDIYDSLCKMMLFDYIIGNKYRDLCNIEVIKYSIITEVSEFRLSPLYSHGSAFNYGAVRDSEHKEFVGVGNLEELENLIERGIKIGRLVEADKSEVMQGIEEIINESTINEIWDCILRRYRHIIELSGTRCVGDGWCLYGKTI